jgi:superfamily II DNA or RNA helicase
MPLDEHWGTNCSTIEDFNFNFVVYKSADRVKEAIEILKNQKKKTIVYVPFTNGVCKYKLVEKLTQQIKLIWPEANVLDLVNEEGRNERKEIFLDPEQAEKIDVILSVRLMDEGVDWNGQNKFLI